MAQNPNPKTQNSLKREFHYYPFGMCFDVSKSPILGKSAKPLKCMLKDYKDMEDFGDFLGVCEAASRNYDAQIGRWLQPDPLMQHPSPYLAMSNNPVSFTDPLGLEDEWFGINSFGHKVGYAKGDGDKRFALMALNERGNYNSEEISEAEYNYYSLNGKFNPFGNSYNGTINVGSNSHPYGAVAANYQNNQLAWGMNLKEGNQPWYSIYNWPVLGSSARTMDALYAGNYLNATAHFLTCAAEVFTFGYASSLNFGAKTLSTAAKGGKPILNAVNTGQRTGSAAYKSLNVDDAQHFFSNIVDNYASQATKFGLKGSDGVTRNLYQIPGSLREQPPGIFEWIVDGANVTHRRFIPGGIVNGIPNQIVR